MKLKILDLFSGLGGFSLGLERTGHFKTVAFCDNDKYSNLVLQKHWKGVKIYNDVKEITKEKLIADGIQFPDIITGGFPCQPFSVAGKQAGTDDDRHLWPVMFRIIQEFTPRWVIGENVKGLVNLQDRMVFETVCTDLEGEGYEVRAFNIPAAGVGAPHRRERIWIVAHAKRYNKIDEIGGSDETSRGIQEEHRQDDSSARLTSRTSSIRQSNNRHDVANTESSIGDDNEAVTRNGGSSTQEVFGDGSSISGEGSWWQTEPDVGRVAHGIPGRVYRLKGLGNSIVPKIAEEIGKAIMEAEADDIEYQGGGAYKAMLKLFNENLK